MEKVYCPVGSWSPMLQHRDIQITGPRLLRYTDTVNGYSVHGLGDTILDDCSPIPYRCSFKINNIAGGLIIGICDPREIIRYNFKGWDATLDHGKYGMDSNGNVKSDWDEEVADQEVGFRYSGGDTIDMEYIPL